MNGRQRAAVVLAALVLVLTTFGSVGTAAAAVPQLPIPGLPDCQTAPTPQPPDRGFGGFVTPTPLDPPGLDATPYTDGSGVSLYETTGLAGYRWHMYADSCIPGPGQVTNQALTSSANSLMSLPVLAVGLVASLADVVYNQTWLTVLDEPVAYVSGALFEGFTEPFFPVLVIAVGLVMVVGLRRARLSAAIGTLALVLVAGTLALFAVNYPTRVADLTDAVTSSAIVSVNSAIAGSADADPAVATVSPLVESILYDRWVAGTLGDTTSPTARQYGPVLYDASTLTWAETEVVRADPDGEGAAIIEAKREQWSEAAEAVEAADPDAYEYLTGARSLDRVGHAVVALFLIGILPFLAVSLLLVAMSYLIIRLIIMFLPLVALLALLMRGTLRSLGSLAAAAVINSVVFAVGAAVTAYLYGVFLSPDSGIPALLGILLALILSIAMWIVLTPYRRLTSLVRGTDPVKQSAQEYARVKKGAQGLVAGAGRIALGVYAGTKAAGARDGASDDETEASPVDGRYRVGPGDVRPEHFSVGQDRMALPGPRRELAAAPVTSPAAISALVVPVSRTPEGSSAPSTPPPALSAGPATAAAPVWTPDGGRDSDGPGLGSSAPRPEMTPLADFDPVVVDGEAVTIVHTLDGPLVDTAAAGARVVPGTVVRGSREQDA